LKACGLREKEISDMLKVCVPSGSTSYTFGVEIECVHAERNAFNATIFSLRGIFDFLISSIVSINDFFELANEKPVCLDIINCASCFGSYPLVSLSPY
jgi:hypothetical protein